MNLILKCRSLPALLWSVRSPCCLPTWIDMLTRSRAFDRRTHRTEQKKNNNNVSSLRCEISESLCIFAAHESQSLREPVHFNMCVCVCDPDQPTTAEMVSVASLPIFSFLVLYEQKWFLHRHTRTPEHHRALFVLWALGIKACDMASGYSVVIRNRAREGWMAANTIVTEHMNINAR